MVSVQEDPAADPAAGATASEKDPVSVHGSVAANKLKSPEFAPPNAKPLPSAAVEALLFNVTFSIRDAPKPSL